MNSSALQPDQLISLQEAGKLLGGVHPRTVRKMCEKGELPKLIKVGKLNRLFLSDVLNYIRNLKGQRKA